MLTFFINHIPQHVSQLAYNELSHAHFHHLAISFLFTSCADCSLALNFLLALGWCLEMFTLPLSGSLLIVSISLCARFPVGKVSLSENVLFPPPQYLTFLENLLLGFTNKHFQRNYFILRLTAQLLIVWLPMVQCLHTICPWHCFSIFPKLYVCFLFQKSNNTVVTLFWYLKLSPDVAIFYMRLSHYEALLI